MDYWMSTDQPMGTNSINISEVQDVHGLGMRTFTDTPTPSFHITVGSSPYTPMPTTVMTLHLTIRSNLAETYIP